MAVLSRSVLRFKGIRNSCTMVAARNEATGRLFLALKAFIGL